ncbi:GerAB/ArcD/ProY family transporter [Effusibacillus pohliae]|uniref:GerAB/ArcD/ProY family transporter n=1 Tax=Effusibacillus pohliae TaxID=232270 RepID=UPI000363F2DD|nr:endospore germination permease [Effusibacillus pohliae]
MRVEEKITSGQLGMLLIPLVMATAILSLPAVMGAVAKQDAWLAAIPASATGIWSVLVLAELGRRYPGMTIIEYSSRIIGGWAAKLLNVYLVYIYYLFVIVIAREHTDFIETVALPRTPVVVEAGVFLVLCGITVYVGIESIGRCCQFLVPFFVLFLIPFFVLSLPNMEFDRLQPFLGNGVLPVLKAAIVPSGWLGEVFVLAFLLPYLDRRSDGRKVSLLAIGIMVLIMIFINLQTITVLGDITSKHNYPFFEVIRYISIAEFIERIDPIIVAAWTMGIFLKEAAFLFVFCVCVKQLFRLSDYRTVVIPLTLLLIIGERWTSDNTADMKQFLTLTFPGAALFTFNLIPSLLLLIDSVKRKKSRGDKSMKHPYHPCVDSEVRR